MSYYVESDGDRVPKDVYICDKEERIATLECASEQRRFRLARLIVRALNHQTALVEACEVLSQAWDDSEMRLGDRKERYEKVEKARAVLLTFKGAA